MRPSSDLLSVTSLEVLREQKNLLAFSAGVDSSALFFLLLEARIPFDIAIVDYNLRAQSKEEVAYAKELAAYHDKVCYHDSITLPTSNFEHQARQHRYAFFEQIIHDEGYDNLLTAHQLNDRLEWFLMQLGRGAGLVEMLGYEEISQREGYRLVRPLIATSKQDLLDFLKRQSKAYFVDESNHHDTYTRNRMRKDFSNAFLTQYQTGIQKSFDYLQKDKEQLFTAKTYYHERALTLLKRSASDLRGVDKVLKEMGYLLSAAQKDEIFRQSSCVISDKIVIEITDDFIFIAPYVKVTMDKKFKELCRTLGIPAKIRPYLLEVGINPSDLPLAGKSF